MKFDFKNYRVIKVDLLANEVDQGLWVSGISAFGERVRLGLYDCCNEAAAIVKSNLGNEL